MLQQVVVASIGNALELAPAEREQVFDVRAGARIVRQIRALFVVEL